MDLRRRVVEFQKEHKLLTQGDRVLVAVSGGPDSVALLHVLTALREELGLQLEVAHLQHGIRGAESQKDARFVAELAVRWELPLHLKTVNIPRMMAEKGKGNLEALARAERYRFFADTAAKRNIGKVATAHTQDDQMETVMMWFLRGCGMKGLGGMAPMHHLHGENKDPSADLIVIRPLLDVSKAEILAYLKEKKLSFRRDRSNLDTHLLRNWLRLKLIPQIRKRMGATLSVRLSQQAKLVRDEDNLLENLARTVLVRLRSANAVNRALFLSEAKVMQRRTLRLWIEEKRGHLRGIEFAHIENLLKFIAAPTPQGRLSISGGWELVKEYEALRLERRSRRPKHHCYSYEWEIGTELLIPEAAMKLYSEWVSPPLTRPPEGFMEAYFDLAAVPETLTVRNFRRGDRFQPLGMVGHKKVKDLFIEKKIPLSVRATLPLLAMEKEILWIPGYGRSNTGKVSPQTRTLLHLKAVPFIR